MVKDCVYIIITAVFPNRSEDGGRLRQTLEIVKRPDEFLFSGVSSAYHADLRLLDSAPPSIPCVAFVWISALNAVTKEHGTKISLSDNLMFAKRHLPCAIFVLYGTLEEHQALISGQIAKDHERCLTYFFLENSEDAGFEDKVRNILDDARKISEKRAKIERFHTAFISYSHQDEKFSQWLYSYLKSFGIKCWLDRKELKAGDIIHRSVESAIERNDKLLLCASEYSLNSWWVDNEINSAIVKEQEIRKRKGKEDPVLIPLNLDGYLFSDGWTNGWKAKIISRLAPNFTKWEKFVEFDLKHDDERMEALKKIEQEEGTGFTSRFYSERKRVVSALYIPGVDLIDTD